MLSLYRPSNLLTYICRLCYLVPQMLDCGWWGKSVINSRDLQSLPFIISYLIIFSLSSLHYISCVVLTIIFFIARGVQYYNLIKNIVVLSSQNSTMPSFGALDSFSRSVYSQHHLIKYLVKLFLKISTSQFLCCLVLSHIKSVFLRFIYCKHFALNFYNAKSSNLPLAFPATFNLNISAYNFCWCLVLNYFYFTIFVMLSLKTSFWCFIKIIEW